MFASSSSSSSSSSSRLAAAPRPSSPFFSTASHRFEKTRRWRRSPDGSAPPGRSARLAAAADDDDVEAAAARDPDPDPDPAPPCAPRPRKQQEQRPRRRGADRRALTRDAPLPPPGRSFAEIAIQQAGDHVHPSHRIPEGTTRPCVPETYRKRAVALLLGYVGRDYRGNTVNPALPRGSTVDDVLEDAVFDAGGILLSNYRSRALSRLKWSRSSRTDKGVSSLATVVSLRMETDERSWDADVEAREPGGVVERINAKLPATSGVRVFAAYSAPKSFQARRACARRTYHYLLPARVLGLGVSGEREVPWPGAPGGETRSSEDVLDAFRDALRAFEGSHYFHNYTRRSRYAPEDKRRRSRGRRGDVEEEEEDEMESSDYRGDDDDDVDDVDASETPSVGSRASGYYWLLGRDDRDLVGKRHARVVSSFTAGDVEVAAGDGDDDDRPGEPFVRVVVAGDSFVLYQIRKMIATAVGVALGWIPREFIPVTLARPARAATPIAPASTLYLREAEFSEFRKNREKKPSPAGGSEKEKENGNGKKMSASASANAAAVVNADLPTTRLARLEASDAVRAEVDAFARDVLEPSLAPSLRDEEWDVFAENLGKLRMCAHGEGKDAVAAMMEAHAAYEIERKAARAAREEAEAADATRSR